GLPGEDEEDGDDQEDGIGADGTGEQVVHVHEGAKKGGDAGKEADDEGDPDQQLANGDHIAPEGGVGEDDVLQEPGIPALDVGMRAAGLFQGAGDEAGDRGAGIVSSPGVGADLAGAGGGPLPAGINAQDQPDPRPADGLEQALRYRRVFQPEHVLQASLF